MTGVNAENIFDDVIDVSLNVCGFTMVVQIELSSSSTEGNVEKIEGITGLIFLSKFEGIMETIKWFYKTSSRTVGSETEKLSRTYFVKIKVISGNLIILLRYSKHPMQVVGSECQFRVLGFVKIASFEVIY